eukprot:scaffold659_cov318-Pavlova_lutheri.AAC.5
MPRGRCFRQASRTAARSKRWKRTTKTAWCKAGRFSLGNVYIFFNILGRSRPLANPMRQRFVQGHPHRGPASDLEGVFRATKLDALAPPRPWSSHLRARPTSRRVSPAIDVGDVAFPFFGLPNFVQGILFGSKGTILGSNRRSLGFVPEIRKDRSISGVRLDRRRRSCGMHLGRVCATGKQNLPQKICVTCGRPFTWRKKWERCWDEVSTCSKRCNAERRKRNREATRTPGGGSQAEAGSDDE